jgi:hypothetical protein
MDTGENCFISVSSTGLIIKESNLGISGRIVFQLSNVEELAFLVKSLSEWQYEDLTPSDMKHPVLKVITNEILHLGALGDISFMFGSWIEMFHSERDNSPESTPRLTDDDAQAILHEMFHSERDNSPESTPPLTDDDAQAIVHAFVDVMAKGAPYVGDASTLPYSKELIGRAFEKHIEHYEMLQKISKDAFQRLGYDEDLNLVRSMFMRLDDWHDIDPEDRGMVARLNALKGPPPEWAMLIIAKYINRQFIK